MDDRPCPNHHPRRTMSVGELLLHLVLTLCTCGLWGPVILLLAVRYALVPAPCPSCGRT